VPALAAAAAAAPASVNFMDLLSLRPPPAT
jgi:hypothetical protein